MVPRIAFLAGLVLAAAPLAAREPLPEILDCAVTTKANWYAESFFTSPYPEDAAYRIHLDTVSGRWYLSNAHAASLTVGGGTFEILHDGTDYPMYWLGLDHRGATQMRIDLYQPGMPFLFVGHDSALYVGRCVEPDEPFVFLR